MTRDKEQLSKCTSLVASEGSIELRPLWHIAVYASYILLYCVHLRYAVWMTGPAEAGTCHDSPSAAIAVPPVLVLWLSRVLQSSGYQPQRDPPCSRGCNCSRSTGRSCGVAPWVEGGRGVGLGLGVGTGAGTGLPPGGLGHGLGALGFGLGPRALEVDTSPSDTSAAWR